MRPTTTRKRELLLSEGEKDLHEDTTFKLRCDGTKKEELSVQAAGGKWSKQLAESVPSGRDGKCKSFRLGIA